MQRLNQTLKLSKSYRLCRAFSNVSTKGLLDISGKYIDLDSRAVVLYNESITDFLSHENNPAKQLKKLFKINKNVAMVNSLLVIQSVRQPTPSNDAEVSEIEEHLSILENLMIEGNLSDRERFFAAAAASLAEGNYLKAAAYFESCTLRTKNDYLALKFSQDAYMLAGDSVNVLGCVARSLHLFDERHKFYGHILGLQATGLMEVGRLSEADEIASRAVVQTQGRDAWALQTLLSTYQLLGRSAEVVVEFASHQGLHSDNTIGFQLLLFNKGTAMVNRGNYSGALRCYDEMIYRMANSPDGEDKIAGNLVNATLLLWQIGLHDPCHTINERWTYSHAVGSLWGSSSALYSFNENNSDRITVDDTVTDGNNDVMDPDQVESNGALRSNSSQQSRAGENKTIDFTPNDFKSSKKNRRLAVMYEMCQSMAISAGAQSESHMLHTAKFPPPIPEGYLKEDEIEENKYKGSPVMETVENASKSLIEGIKNMFKTVPLPTGKRDTVDLSGGSGMFSESNSVIKEVIKPKTYNYQTSLEKLIDLLKTDSAESDFNAICPTLLSIEPSVRVMRRVNERDRLGNISDNSHAYELTGKPLIDGMLSFSSNNYKESNNKFDMHCQDHNIRRLGGTALQRDIILNTYIESLLRSGCLAEAEVMLRERTARTINDGQSWRRLASVYGQLGKLDEAEKCNYIAWQLGIAQGGFGGPK